MRASARLATVAIVSLFLSLVVATQPAIAAVHPTVGTTVTAAQIPGLLRVAAETTSPAYSRDRFAHWIDADGNGCNTRYEVLIAQSTTPVTVGPGCALTGGTWVSLYDGFTATAPANIEIDHVVALAEAWRSGASAWTDEQRQAFANDVTVPYALVTASSASNQSKADKDPAKWRPTNQEYVCEYVTAWVLTKYRWTLAVDQAELNELNNQFIGPCGRQTITLPELASTTPHITFTDTVGHVFENQITWLVTKGIARGWEVGSNRYEFRPQAQILRGEMAAFLYRLAGEPAFTPPAVSPFVDISPDFVFYKPIVWLAGVGISRGWETSRGVEFRPFAATSRDVMSAFLYRFKGTPTHVAGVSPFRDVSSNTVFSNEILWLASEGISTGWDVGYGCYEYRPYQNVTRSEMAAFIYRAENGGTTPLAGNNCKPPAPPSPPAPPTPQPPTYANAVTAGAFCAQQYAGWYGRTSAGVLMQCKASSTESRLRWRRA